VPNERNLQVFTFVKGTLEQPLRLPFLKKTAQPIARILKQALQRRPSRRDVKAAAEGTTHVGGYPVHLSLFSTPTDHGDLLTVRIVDPSLVSGSTEVTAAADDDEFTLAGFDDDSPPPAPPPSSPEEVRWFSLGWKSWDPTICDTSDG
jgi:hypothetical protein